MAKISVIIGPPGTGKTETLKERAARAAACYGFDKVLISSLTRTGANEIASRVELPRDQMATVHGHASRALGSPIIAESKVSEWNEAYPIYALSSHSATADDGYHLEDKPTQYDTVKMDMARLRAMGLDPADALSAGVVDFHRHWEDWKKQNHYLDFADLITCAIRECPHAPGQPAVLMNDEAQDTGMAEMQLLLKWASHPSCEHLVLAGDPAQGIFTWRGSDPMVLQNLWQERDSKRQPLQQSHRLSKAVYQEAYKWAGRFQETMRVSFLPTSSEGSVKRVGWGMDSLTPGGVEKLLKEYEGIETGDTTPILFLTTCGYMLDPLIESLREVGVPYFNPWRPNNGKWQSLPRRASKGTTLVDKVLAFLRPRTDLWGDEARFWTAPEFKAWGSALPATGIFTRGGQKALKELSDHATDVDIATAFSNWLLPEAVSRILPKPNLDWYMENVKGADRLRAFINTVIDRHGVQKLRERPKVAVGTVHSIKGGEAHTVFLCPDVSGEAHTAAMSDPRNAEELRRVFYVGLTRAKENLVLLRPSSRQAVRW